MPAVPAAPAPRTSAGRGWLPPLLLGAFVLVWAWAAWDPLFRRDWLLENILVFLAVPLLVATARWMRFTDGSYVLWFAFLSLHVVGSHWTYSNVPWPDWESLGFERNQYDRVVHLAYGLLLALPAREVLARLAGRQGGFVSYLAVESILATSALYEIMEWVTVLVVDPAAGQAFLGAQGDAFDAMADMALAGLGAVAAMLMFEAWSWARRRRARASGDGQPSSL